MDYNKEYISCETCDNNIYQLTDGKTQWCYCDICEGDDMHSDNTIKGELTLTPLEAEQGNEATINNAYGTITRAAETLTDKIRVIARAFRINTEQPYINQRLFAMLVQSNNKRKYTGKPLRRNVPKRYRGW